jgi:hypothetical protein
MSDLSLFGLLIVDRDPYTFADLGGLVQAWLMDAGGFAMLGLIAYLIYALRIPSDQQASAKERAGVTGFMLAMAVLALLAYSAYGFLVFTGRGVDTVNVPVVPQPGQFVKYVPPKVSKDLQPLVLTAGGLFALLGIGQPFVGSLAKVRGRRLVALSRLGFKEAVRSRLFWVFLVFILPFLFPAKWFVPVKPEDELRSWVAVVSLFMNILLLLPAALLAAFSIPNDIKNQNIYTVLTKPVERFEVVFGRFVGYTALMTLALAGMTLLSWGIIRFGTTLDAKAQEETFKARVPLRGEMRFASRKGDNIEGTNVGREFDYRRYIGGDPASSQRAVWGFRSIPSSLTAADRDSVPCEFTFDIFRLTKGEENRGVDLTIRVVSHTCGQVPPTEPNDGTWKWADKAKEEEYLKEASELVRQLPGVTEQQAANPATVLALARPGTEAWAKVVNPLAEKYGFYEVSGKEIFDYHPDSIDVPTGLFRNAAQGEPKAAAPGGPAPARASVYVKCNTRGQLLGMAEPDLYLLEGERTFDENYFKSAVGLWCRVTLIIGLAVVCSTYLAGVISFLAACLLFLAGYFSDHIADLASGQSYVGGPFRAMNQLLRAEQPTAQADPNSALTGAIGYFDSAFAWGVRRFVNLVPDVYAYSWTGYVSEGFNIPVGGLVMNLILMAGYLLPWLILGYYLIRSREVAG